MASGFQEAQSDLHFSRLTNTGDSLLQSWATVLLRLGLLGGRITGQYPLDTALDSLTGPIARVQKEAVRRDLAKV